MENLPRTLLLVDDEVIIAMAQAQLLKKEGYNVLQAYNGPEAIDMVRNGNHAIDLILMDIDLGAGMDGTDAALDILKDHDLPVVFLSSHTERDIVEKTEKITSYGYIVKDSGITVLTASIKMAFKLHEAHRELTKKEKSLRKVEEKTRNIINNLPLGIHQYRMEADGRLIFEGANAAADRLLKINNSGCIGLSIEEAFPNLIATEVPDRYRQVCAEGTPWHANRIEYEDVRIKGAYEIHAFQTEPGHMAVLFNDITERQNAEERMRILSTLVDIAPASITVHDFDGNFIYANQKTFELHGYTEEEFFHINLRDLDVPESSRLIEPRMKQLLEKGEMSFEACHFRKDGSLLPLNIHVKTSVWSGARVLLSVAMDVTERKKADDALQESESKYRRFFDQSPVGAAVSTPDYHFISVNAEMCRMMGYSGEEFASLSFMDITHPDYLNTDIEQVRRLQSGEIDFYSTDKRYIRKDGTAIWGHLSLRGIRDAGGGLLYFLPMIVDITERKRAEEALRESEARYLRITETLTDYIYTVYVENGKAVETRHGPGCLAVTGYTEEEFNNDPYLWYRIIDARDRAAVEDHARGIVPDIVTQAIEHRIVRKDGVERWVRNTPVPRHDELGRLLSYDGLIQDITDRKTIEEAFKEREEIFKIFMKNSPVYVFFKDENIRAAQLSDNYEKLLGRPMHELIGKTMYDLFPSEVARSMVEDDRKVLRDGRQVDVIEEFNGRVYSTTKFPIPRLDKPPFLAGFTVDITEQKAAEKALRESEGKYRRLFENASMGVFHSLPNGRFLEVNPSLARMVGYESPEEMVRIVTNISAQIYIDPKDRADLLVATMNAEGWIYTQNNYRRKDGSLMIGNLALRKELNPDGSVAYLEGFIEDITDRKRAEEARQLSDALFRSMVESSPLAIIVSVGLEGTFEYINPKFKEFFGFNLDDIHNAKDWWKLAYPDKDYRKQIVSEWLQRKQIVAERLDFEPFEATVTCKDGSKRVIEFKLVCIGDKYITFGTDLTQRKKAEEALAKSAEEKELLLKELQHRVKNNLNVISSLLGLELDKLKDDRTKQIFINAQYRIRSMSAIYEQLYNSAALDSVDLERYIKDLAESLFETYAIDNKSVRLTTRIEKIQIDLKRAIPLGLILNELIMNALKHAFPINKKGVIRVDLVKSKDSVALSVSDNGVGFPEGVNPGTADTMGLRLVRMLTQQIGGELSFDKKRGVKTLVKFRLQ